VAKPLSFKDFIAVDYTQTGDDLLAYQAHKRHRGTVGEACWQGYTQKGMKPKNGKMVPNCVPEEDQQDEAISLQGRRALSRAMKRRKNQLALARRRNRQKTAGQSRLQTRSTRQARNQLFKRFSGGKARSSLTPTRRAGIEKKVQSMQGRIKAIARKILPDVRKADKARRG